MPDATTRYSIRPSPESTFTPEVFKTGLMARKKHLLFFEQYDGEIEYNTQRIEDSKVRFTVQASSATCKDNWVKPEDRKKILEQANEPAAINPLSCPIAAESVRLGDDFHRDPADQIIVATARCHDLTLITADERIRCWGKVRVV